jgi:hypothetical protein
MDFIIQNFSKFRQFFKTNPHLPDILLLKMAGDDKILNHNRDNHRRLLLAKVNPCVKP